jgi:perosamine synthetase
MQIPVYQPSLSGKEKEYVNECLNSSWISSKGKFINEFERAFEEFHGVKHALSVSNGTVALHLALVALGIGPGDEVIVPTFTYIASVNAITYTGAKAVFVDSLADTWQVDPADIEAKITSETKAIMPVHLYGHACDMHEIMKVAEKHKLYVVEDCAEAFGSKYQRQYVGSFGHVSTFSFFGNKTITTGEGGMVVTNDITLRDRMFKLKGQGLAANREYWHDVVGYNYRMTNICAAIGLAQIQRANEIIEKKREIARLYQEGLKDLPVVMHAESPEVFHTYWMVSILVEKASERDGLRAHLAKAGIETRPTFYPAHIMPIYARSERHPVAEDLSARGMNLPSWPELDKEKIEYITNSIREFYTK